MGQAASTANSVSPLVTSDANIVPVGTQQQGPNGGSSVNASQIKDAVHTMPSQAFTAVLNEKSRCTRGCSQGVQQSGGQQSSGEPPCAWSAANSVAAHVRGADCVQRAQEAFLFEKDLSRYNRLNDSVPCSSACNHEFQTACRRGCSQSDLMWESNVVTPYQRFEREGAVLAKQLAAQQNNLHTNQRYGAFDTVPTKGRNSASAAPIAPNVNGIGQHPVPANRGGVIGAANTHTSTHNTNSVMAAAIRNANQTARDEETIETIQGIARPANGSTQLEKSDSTLRNVIAANNALVASGVLPAETALAANSILINNASVSANTSGHASNQPSNPFNGFLGL